MKLASLGPAIQDLLRITKLLGVLEVHKGVDQAVRAFRKAASA